MSENQGGFVGIRRGIMRARLGKILYWAACGIAALFLLMGGVYLFGAIYLGTVKEWEAWLHAISLALLAGLVWLVGRAILYLLARR
jgi:hypothetical protein